MTIAISRRRGGSYSPDQHHAVALAVPRVPGTRPARPASCLRDPLRTPCRLQIVAVSRHLGFLAKRAVQRAAPQFRLKELRVKDVTWRHPIGVIYREGGYLSPSARRFIEILKTTAKDTAAR